MKKFKIFIFNQRFYYRHRYLDWFPTMATRHLLHTPIGLPTNDVNKKMKKNEKNGKKSVEI